MTINGIDGFKFHNLTLTTWLITSHSKSNEGSICYATKIDHFGEVLISQSLTLALPKENKPYTNNRHAPIN